MGEYVDKLFSYIDSKVGPNAKDHKPACHDGREMLLECVLESKCMKDHENFRYCIQDGIDKECKALRYDYHLCRRSQVYWERSLRDDPR